MIKALTVTNAQGESLRIELANPYETGLAIRGITGLVPPKATINMTELATSDGAVYNSARGLKRNIVIYFAYTHSPTIEAVRRKSYKFFPLKEKVTLVVETDDNSYMVEGYVEANEAVIFSDKTGGQVSIMCPSSYLESAALYEEILSDLVPKFEFPFSNESLTEQLIEFGTIKPNTGAIIDYDGDAEAGINVTISATASVTNLMFYNASTREFMKIDTTKLQALTGETIIAGDIIEISTIRGDKRATLFRDGEYINIINVISRDSTWLQLRKGENVFAYTADTGELSINVSISYRKLYEGV